MDDDKQPLDRARDHLTSLADIFMEMDLVKRQRDELRDKIASVARALESQPSAEAFVKGLPPEVAQQLGDLFLEGTMRAAEIPPGVSGRYTPAIRGRDRDSAPQRSATREQHMALLEASPGKVSKHAACNGLGCAECAGTGLAVESPERAAAAEAAARELAQERGARREQHMADLETTTNKISKHAACEGRGCDGCMGTGLVIEHGT